MSKSESLRRQADRFGIEAGYWDIGGTWHETSDSVIEELLHLGRAGDEPAPSKGISRVVSSGESFELLLPLHEAWGEASEVGLRIAVEGADERLLQVPVRSEMLDDQHPALRLFFPPISECGYHQLTFTLPNLATASIQLIVCPKNCYQPVSGESGRQRHFGVSCQIYSLASQEAGIGNFRDLRQLSTRVKALGASFLGINPLHAITPRQFSPYSPDSRIAYNVLYIDLAEAADFLGVEKSAGLRAEASAEGGGYIDYPAVFASHTLALQVLFEDFYDSETAQRAAFETFLAQAPIALRHYALYQSLQQHFSERDPETEGWMQWPEEYHRVDSQSTEAFAAGHAREIHFHLFAQWLARVQLEKCAAVFAEEEIGLYSDVALGVNANGADAWIFRDCLTFGVSVGAPPDAFNPEGQDWGLPPLHPQRLAAHHFEPFILSLREAMRFAGAVRIDHVMSLFRLFWVSSISKQGAYVRYPLEALFGILALESQRNGCMVIGEDLGTVPDEVREAMHSYGVLSYKVVIFMREWDGAFCESKHYPPDSLVTVSTHDLPTVAAYISGSDISLRDELNLHTAEVIHSMREERSASLARLRERFEAEGVFVGESVQELVEASSRFIASTPSQLAVIQLEDLALMQEQVNIPGTVSEHPNWCRKLAKPYGQLLEEPWIRATLNDVARIRTEETER